MSNHEELLESYIRKELLSFCPSINEEDIFQCVKISKDFFKGLTNINEAKESIIAQCGNAKIIDKLEYILSIDISPKELSATVYHINKKAKNTLWTDIEDTKLVASVLRYGIEDWNIISSLVSGKTPSQCYQRWSKSLDPRISRSAWNQEEDEKLINCVKIFGEKSWQKISSIMGNRSDSQCRFRYKQITNQSENTEHSYEVVANINSASKIDPMQYYNKRRNSITIASF